MHSNLNIFLASSSELSRERLYIGNRMRMLNDLWEPQGVRIVLNVWEDYYPEFAGERKQTEYDLDLVDRSEIVFGLFRTVCGRYSQEEVRRGYNNNPDTLHCFRMPSDDDEAVRSFSDTRGILMEEVADIEGVWDRMQYIIEAYIASHSLATSTIQHVNKEKVYVTIGEDLRAEEDAVGDMMRGMDLLAEQRMGLRCMMLPMKDVRAVAESDYYVALFDRVLDKQSGDEFVAAYHGLVSHRHPAEMATFQKEGGTVTRRDAENEVADLMWRQGREFFPIMFAGLDKVKLTLLAYLLRKKHVLSTQGYFSLGENGGLYLRGRRVVEMSNALGLASEHVNDYVVHVELLELMMPSVPKLGVEARLRDDIKQLLSEKSLDAGGARTLVGKCSSLIDFLKQRTGKYYQPDYVLRMMLLRIACNDRYEELAGYTPDQYYKDFVDYADRYSIEDVWVEEMRMNLANGFARAGREDEALRLYGMVRRNLQRLAGNEVSMRPKIFLLYYNAMAALSTIGQQYELNQWAEELDALTGSWISEDATLAYYRCYPVAFRIDVIPVDVLADNGLIENAESCWKEVAGKVGQSCDRYSCLAALHALTKSLSRYYVDRISVEGLSMDTVKAYAEKAQYYLDREEEYCKELMTYDREDAMKHYASMLHNRGFLLIKMGNPMRAIGSYLQSLLLRKQLFDRYPTASREDDVAETMVNIGALLLETPGRFVSDKPEVRTDAIWYADAALEIYSRHNDGTLYHATNEYKARLLKGTILYHKGEDENQRRQGLEILRSVKQWDEEHPDNYYHSTITDELRKVMWRENDSLNDNDDLNSRH